jgi:hypothetical protein
MSNNAFRQPISADRAPEGHLCDGCDKLAVHQLTATEGLIVCNTVPVLDYQVDPHNRGTPEQVQRAAMSWSRLQE